MQAAPDPAHENAVDRPRVLVVDDEADLVHMLRRVLERAGFASEGARDAAELERALGSELPAVVLLDLQLGAVRGIEWIGRIRAQSLDTEVVVITGHASVDSAVESMRAGAFDYLEKPFGDPQRIVATVRRALELRRRRVRERSRGLAGEPERRSVLERIVCRSASMQGVLETVRGLARSESSVLIEAESGTGKELVARAIHETSPRGAGPFVAVDCAAVPSGIAQGELFGYERGAFTGAVRAASGLFRSASGGTLFLDEVGELAPLLQAKLLRALQEREVRPLGSDRTVPIDVRVIAATNRGLLAEIEAGRFRADLYYRLRVVSIALAPLRERPEDISVLAEHFLRGVRGSAAHEIAPEAREALVAQPWRGNVRELQNTIEAAAALARGPLLGVADLRLAEAVGSATAPRPQQIELSLRAYERACLEEALQRTQGDVRRAATLLGIGRSTLYRKLGSPERTAPRRS